MPGTPPVTIQHPGRLTRQLLVLGLSLLLGGAWTWSLPCLPCQAAPPSPSNTATALLNRPPAVGQTTRLYEGADNTGTPDTQGFLYVADSASAIQTFSDGITTLDTTASQAIHAGYFSQSPLKLDRETGYTLRFTTHLLSESHTGPDRAGFSVIALSSDLQGIELGFWEDEIWAQEGGLSPNLFTHAEGAAFDTTAGLIPYELTILGNTYALATGSTAILSGTLRDYTAFNGFPDPYETPNLVFLGDDTTSAQASIRISSVQVITDNAPASRTVGAGHPLVINDLGIMDSDAQGSPVVVTLTVAHGTLTATTTAPGGLGSGAIQGNGSASLTLTGAPGTINSTLLITGGLRYQSYVDFEGTERLTIQVNDQGHTSGSALTDSKTCMITITGTEKTQLFLPLILKQHP